MVAHVRQAVEAALAAMTEDDLKCQQGALERDGQFVLGDHVITSAMVDIKPEQRKLSGRCAPRTVILLLLLLGISTCPSLYTGQSYTAPYVVRIGPEKRSKGPSYSSPSTTPGLASLLPVVRLSLVPQCPSVNSRF